MPNSVGLLALPLRIDLGMRLEQAHDLARQLRHTIEEAHLGLLHHLPDPARHDAQMLAQTPQIFLLLGRHLLDFGDYSFGIIEDLA